MSGATDREVDLISATHEIGFRKGVCAERKRLLDLSADEFLIEKLQRKLENTTICLEPKL